MTKQKPCGKIAIARICSLKSSRGARQHYNRAHHVPVHRFFIVCILWTAAAAVSAPLSKPTVAVLALNASGGVTAGEADIITDRFRVELFRTGCVEVMERQQMAAVLREQGFQSTGACSEEGCMVEMGQLLGVTCMLAGSVGKLGSLYLLNIRSIHVATGKIEQVVSHDIRGSIEDVVMHLRPAAMEITGCEEARRSPQTAPPIQPRPPVANESRETTATRSCDTHVFLHQLDFTPVGFSPTQETIAEIHDMLLDAFEECLDTDVGLAEEESPEVACDPYTIRAHIHSYTTRPSILKQKIGTARVTFSFHAPSSPQAAIAIEIEKSGDRHWDNDQPLENAFEEIAEVVEERFERERSIRRFRKEIHDRQGEFEPD